MELRRALRYYYWCILLGTRPVTETIKMHRLCAKSRPSQTTNHNARVKEVKSCSREKPEKMQLRQGGFETKSFVFFCGSKTSKKTIC